MARIQKRTTASGSATYVVKWRTPDGKDRSKGGFATRKAANAYATKAENAALQGNDFDPAKGKVSFRDAAAIWLASRADLKATTHAAYRDALAPTNPDTVKRHASLAELRIDAVFGDYPLNKITRDQIRAWVARMQAAGKRPSTIRNAYFLVRMVLAQAVEDGRLSSNPADYVKLPTEHNTTGARALDDPAQFLTAVQVAALVAATPWPFNSLVHVAAWTGLRAAELAGLQVGDLTLPKPGLNPNAATKPGSLRVERTTARLGGALTYVTPKTKGSRRRVPLTAATTELLRAYLAEHPRRDEPTAPLWPGMAMTRPTPTGVPASPANGGAATTATGTPTPAKARARRQADALADLTVAEAEARIVLDWTARLRHATFYKSVFRPAVLRANRITPTVKIAPDQSFHSLRHTYASLCIASGRPPLEIARFMGHAKVTTTLGVYAHLFSTDDHADAMAALGSMEATPEYAENVVPLWG